MIYKILKKIPIWSMLLPVVLSASKATTYGYSIQSKTINNEASDTFPETQLLFSQNNKETYSLKDYKIDKLYRGDLDGDGYEELLISAFSGGAHCCFEYTIIELRPNMPKPYTFLNHNSDMIEIKDIDGDNKVEVLMWDDRYSYFGGLCFACSPWVKVIAHYRSGKLKLDAKLTKKFYDTKEVNLTKSFVSINKKEKLHLDNIDAGATISQVLHFFYTGETQKAIFVMSKYFKFKQSSARKLFLESLLYQMSKSPFWDDLRVINHWHNDRLHNNKKSYKKEKALWSTDKVSNMLLNNLISKTKP